MIDSGLPNNVRTAATSTLTGFHEATHCNTFGNVLIGTNALLMNVSGKTTMNPTPITASGERTIIPIHVPIQIIAEAKTSSSNSASTTCSRSVCVRQPTARPAPRSTTMDSTAPTSSAR